MEKTVVTAGFTASHPEPHKLQEAMLDAVDLGMVLKLEVWQGSDLLAMLDKYKVKSSRPIDPKAWYGIVAALGIITSGFDKKSQAMNGLVLSLANIKVVSDRDPPPTRAKPKANV